jgi:RNA-binding protein
MQSAMAPPTSPKKRSLMPTGDLRRSLRGHGHALVALVHVGKAGVTDALVKQLTQVLLDHELVKVKVAAECPADRFEVAERLGAEPGTSVVQIIGRTILLYKRHPQTPRYEGERALPPGAAAPDARRPAGDAAPRSPARPARGASTSKANGKRRPLRRGERRTVRREDR